MNAKELFAHRLKALRIEKNMSLTELANELNTTSQSLSLYERAERTANIDLLCKIAIFFNVSTDYLTGLSNKKNGNEDEQDISNMKLSDAAKISERLTGLSQSTIMTLTAYHLNLKEFTAILNELFEHKELLDELFARLSDLSENSYISSKLFNKPTLNEKAYYYNNEASSIRYHLHFIFEKILDIYDYRKLYSVILAPFAEKLYNEVEEDIKKNGKHNPPEE